jgi:hypothetical protein
MALGGQLTSYNKMEISIMENKFNFAKMRCIKKAWMLEDVWEWWMPLVDHSSNTRPKYGPMGLMFSFMKTNFGNNLNAQGPNGPNIELRSNDTA